MPFSSPGDLPDPGIESGSPTLQAYSLPSESPEKPCKNTLGKPYKNTQKNYTKKFLIWLTHLEPDVLDYKVKWALEDITMNKASGGDEIPAELLQILKDDAVEVLQSICQQIWKDQKWPQD